MSKGRKNGCPVNIKDWVIEIKDPATEEFVRIHGLNSMTYNTSADTEDGSLATDNWSEPYVSKRSGSISLEGRPVVDAATGEIDRGQELLNEFADMVGCDGDATLRIKDSYGHATIIDAVVTGKDKGATDSEETVSWDLEQVGEAELEAYIQVGAVAIQQGGVTKTTDTLTVGGESKIYTLAFTPATASNQRFRITCDKRSVASVTNITDNGFTLVPVSAGEAHITVTTVNGGKTSTLTITVSAGS